MNPAIESRFSLTHTQSQSMARNIIKSSWPQWSTHRHIRAGGGGCQVELCHNISFLCSLVSWTQCQHGWVVDVSPCGGCVHCFRQLQEWSQSNRIESNDRCWQPWCSIARSLFAVARCRMVSSGGDAAPVHCTTACTKFAWRCRGRLQFTRTRQQQTLPLNVHSTCTLLRRRPVDIQHSDAVYENCHCHCQSAS